MATTWIVAADSARARVLQVADREQHLVEIEDFPNPEGRMNERDLTSDAQPRLNGPGGAQSAREATGAVQHTVELFSKRIGSFLDKARAEHRYDRLVVVAPPKFLGTLRKDLGKEVTKLVAEEIPKDLSWFNEREIERYLRKAT